ncbi:MAG: DUF3482 domain-containing protein, partial [Proteobacteria bacterium]|nr:DUF3482 domain-containing protein [Pseudomonadota bacterium]
HGRRDLAELTGKTDIKKKGYSTDFTTAQRNICAKFFKTVTGRSFAGGKKTMSDFEELVESVLNEISRE